MPNGGGFSHKEEMERNAAYAAMQAEIIELRSRLHRVTKPTHRKKLFDDIAETEKNCLVDSETAGLCLVARAILVVGDVVESLGNLKGGVHNAH